MISVRVQAPDGAVTAEIASDAPLHTLQKVIFEKTAIAIEDQVLLSGFPPTAIDTGDSATPISNLIGGGGARILLRRRAATAPPPQQPEEASSSFSSSASSAKRSSTAEPSGPSSSAELPPPRKKAAASLPPHVPAPEGSPLHNIFLSGVEDAHESYKYMCEVDCRLWETGFEARAGSGGRVFTLSHGEGKLADKPADTEVERERNIRHLTKSADKVRDAIKSGKPVWIHCHMGINRGPAGLMAYLLLHTAVPSLAAVFELIKEHDQHRRRAHTARNTFAKELARICVRCGKELGMPPLE
jgi:hypothetical protein